MKHVYVAACEPVVLDARLAWNAGVGRGDRLSTSRQRVFDLLRAHDRRCTVHVWAHVYVLRVRRAAVARQGRWPLSVVSSAHPRCHPYLQVLIICYSSTT